MSFEVKVKADKSLVWLPHFSKPPTEMPSAATSVGTCLPMQLANIFAGRHKKPSELMLDFFKKNNVLVDMKGWTLEQAVAVFEACGIKINKSVKTHTTIDSIGRELLAGNPSIIVFRDTVIDEITDGCWISPMPIELSQQSIRRVYNRRPHSCHAYLAWGIDLAGGSMLLRDTRRVYGYNGFNRVSIHTCARLLRAKSRPAAAFTISLAH